MFLFEIRLLKLSLRLPLKELAVRFNNVIENLNFVYRLVFAYLRDQTSECFVFFDKFIIEFVDFFGGDV